LYIRLTTICRTTRIGHVRRKSDISFQFSRIIILILQTTVVPMCIVFTIPTSTFNFTLKLWQYYSPDADFQIMCVNNICIEIIQCFKHDTMTRSLIITTYNMIFTYSFLLLLHCNYCFALDSLSFPEYNIVIKIGGNHLLILESLHGFSVPIHWVKIEPIVVCILKNVHFPGVYKQIGSFLSSKWDIQTDPWECNSRNGHLIEDCKIILCR